MNAAVIRFPGSNCDLDVVSALQNMKGVRPKLVWHEDGGLESFDAIVLPGGFTFGDHLRAGAIAARSPAISSVRKLAERGRPVLGICNGFQILVEAGILPGCLLRNSGLRFVCRWINLRVESRRTPFTSLAKKGSVLKMPVAHNEGRFFAPPEDVRRLAKSNSVVLRYSDDEGRTTPRSNPNGSMDNIAAVCNREGNVLGMMPHPERASDPLLSPFGDSDGKVIFDSLIHSVAGGA